MTKASFLTWLVVLIGALLASAASLALFAGIYLFHPARSGGISLTVEVLADGESTSLIGESVETLRARLSALAGGKPRISVDEGSPRVIHAEIPGVIASEAITKLVEDPGLLELRLAEGKPAGSRAEILERLGGVVPDDRQVLCSADTEPDAYRCYLLEMEAVVANRDFEWVHPSTGEFNEPSSCSS